MKLREAAEQALEALMEKGEHHQKVYRAAEALRQALAQPERKWVGLTDEEKYDVLEGATGDGGRVYYDTLFRSYEAKLREKNA